VRIIIIIIEGGAKGFCNYYNETFENTLEIIGELKIIALKK